MKANGNSTRRRTKSELTASKLRSAVTNGRRLFVFGNGNSAWSRRYRDLIAGHCSDAGGRDLLSEAQLSLVKRASAIELELEQCEGKLSMGEVVDLDQYARVAGHLRRILESLGLKRVARNVGPDLNALIKQVTKRPRINGVVRET
jgi:hypothetical protein